MAKAKKITFTGSGGEIYEFYVYPFGTSFLKVAVVYCLTRCDISAAGGEIHTPIYIGQTGDLLYCSPLALDTFLG